MIRLTKINPLKNEARFYLAQVVPSLFGQWGLLREWGRIGQPGTVRQDWFSSQNKAKAALKALVDSKCRRGYQLAEP